MKLTEAEIVANRLLDGDDELFEMANLQSSRTGVRHVLWFSTDPETKHHRPRGKIKVKKGAKAAWYPFSIDEPVQWLAEPAPGVSARDFEQIVQFVRLNRETLVAYWNGEIFTDEFIARIQKV